MTVQVIATKPVDDTKQWVMVSLTVDGDECRYTTVQPWNTTQPVLSGQDLADYANSREDWLTLNILKQMYPGARYAEFEGDTELEKFQAWVTAGHTNAEYVEEEVTIPEEVIAKVPWVSSWNVQIVTAEADMKESVFYNKTEAQLNTYIDANWSDIATSKATFKKLVKEVRDVVLRHGWE